ncbi:AT-hook motif nuclear-localized protein 5 [Spatholobus suberectus]|nr:AT-hook motif nuclear-localized protein 5 [Spatholobus suberectus]
MDGREGMAFPGGSAPYYMQHRGGGVSGSGPGTGTHSGGFQPPSGFRALSNVSSGSTFSVEPQPQRASFGHGISIGSSPDGGALVPYSGEPVKKKRGRPRKYGPDGTVSLGLSPMSATANSTPGGSGTPAEKRPRGRPPGSGRKQQLASLGEWMNSSAGLAFSPHVITVGVGEDIVAKLLSFSQQRPRAVCILTGTGTVSSVTLRQPASTSVSVTYEGRFQILCLSGSYLVAEEGGPRNRTGGMSVSLSSPDGHVIGGGVARLIAASPVQVVACSFVYGGSKPKTKQGTTTKDSSSEPQSSDKLASPASAPPNQNYTSSPAPGIWPASRPVEVKSAHPHTGIDLTRG